MSQKLYSFTGLHNGISEVVAHGLTLEEIKDLMECDADHYYGMDCWNCEDSQRFMRDLEEKSQAVSVVYDREGIEPHASGTYVTATSVAWYEGLSE